MDLLKLLNTSTFLSFLVYKFKRLELYIQKKVLLKYILLKLFGGHKVLSKKNEVLTIRTRFERIIYELPTTPDHYLFAANPLNELLLSTYMNISKGTFIDVGAFIGRHSIRLAKKKCVRVISIEPNPISVRLLKRNAFLNQVQDKIEIIPMALVSDDLAMEVPFELNFDRSTLLNKHDSLNGHSIVRTISFRKLITNYKIDFNNEVMMKIDIEGYEFELLKSIKEFLFTSGYNFKVVSEILHSSPHKGETIKYLKSFGFNHIQVDSENFFFFKN